MSCYALYNKKKGCTACYKGDTGPQGPEGPEGPQGESGMGLVNMLFFDEMEYEGSAGKLVVKDLSYNNSITTDSGINGYFTESTDISTNIIFSETNPIDLSTGEYGLEFYAYSDLSSNSTKDQTDTVFFDFSGTSIESGSIDYFSLDTRSISVLSGQISRVAFGPLMLRVKNDPTTSLCIHTNNKYRVKVSVLFDINNGQVKLLNTKLTIKAIKLGIT